ncbi:MAG: GNAT family N-acetyltransferase [Alphaproteobacteria bacterium]|nr:GNAT family N-acetyltransferase [Alphaproteobacteria bacterium]
MPADAPALGIAMRDANITETTMFEAPARTSEEGTARASARITDFSEHWCRYGFGIYGAFDRKTEALVGYSGLRHIDEFDGDIHISTMVDRPFWSSGLGAEIIRLNLENGFLEQNFDVVYATTRILEQASLRLMDTFGFIRQPDRMLRHWPVHYYVLPKEVFLARHVNYLKQCLKDLAEKSLAENGSGSSQHPSQHPSQQLSAGNPADRNLAGDDASAARIARNCSSGAVGLA